MASLPWSAAAAAELPAAASKPPSGAAPSPHPAPALPAARPSPATVDRKAEEQKPREASNDELSTELAHLEREGTPAVGVYRLLN